MALRKDFATGTKYYYDFVYNFIYIKDGNAPLEIFQSVFDTVVDLLSRPHEAVFEVLKDIYLSDSLRGTLFPASPIPVIVKKVLSGTGLKNLIP